jgi:single-strand DNA-binding protein
VNNFLHKGSKVVIEGRLSPDPSTGNPRIWNRQDGSPAASFEVTASTVRFLSSRGEGGASEEAGDLPETDAGDEIPF